ncbi:hypothetical protein E1B28_012202 [Marasmius oreades]|uniref:Protein kinase domain-containing protein n=1 Tax=Marasmius oreades TaxID=181124 RepID=A0A9P7RR31_9AGAR|nr:uncharacterized protein E1B28_012202 [Marasmius oreades]KAG7088184.1 hypothetical protein E1B28_012202 [Marasmius oreades]
MSTMDHGSSHEKSNDVFSFGDDEELTRRLRFIKEVGFGNWGSVWKCEPRSTEMLSTGDSFDQSLKSSFAVKLVHRRGGKPEEVKTSAARVKSLWNEMRIVRQFKLDPHPSIIPFYSFLLTPSYALVTMAYYPDLITVQVAETYARRWFRFLLSAVEYLHKRGVVHNDIKPANILMSPKGVPVLCDFGFAESYDLESSTAFHSRCSYGTPEYLSPERARGIPHDTRKSDMWSLGVTFFEVLVGRTPFEESDTDNCLTHEDLEKYWSRTLRGKWIGSWKMSKGVEKLLRRMLAPNADLRCTATEAMKDSYWMTDVQSSHRKSSSYGSSIVFEKDITKLMDISTPWTSPSNGDGDKSRIVSRIVSPDSSARTKTVNKSKSQPKVNATKAPIRKRAGPKPVDLSPIKGSPPTSPNAVTIKNVLSDGNPRRRQPFGVVSPSQNNIPALKMVNKPSGVQLTEKNRVGMLAELAGPSKKGKGKENHVTQRVQDWERERQRLRELSRLEELERDVATGDQEPSEGQVREDDRKKSVMDEKEQDHREPSHPDFSSLSLPQIPVTSPMRVPSVHVTTNDPESVMQTSIERRRSGFFTHRIRASIDRTMQKYKSSTLGRNNSLRDLTTDRQEELESRVSHSERESWEDEALVREAKSSLPVVRRAIHNERVGADNQVDRLHLWMRNVERVVEDARQSFTNGQAATLPPLPLPPASRPHSNRTSRLPRRVLAASEIFSDQSLPDSSAIDQTMSFYITSAKPTEPTAIPPEPHVTPSRPRRATVSISSPAHVTSPFELNESPSKRKEKSRSYGNLLQCHITPPSELAAALNQEPDPPSSPRLSTAVDRSIFILPPVKSRDDVDHLNTPPPFSKSFDELTSSPLIVEPYPPRESYTPDRPVPDSPAQRKLEGVYDRFLMATSGVKRVGKGYQSDIRGPVHSTVQPPENVPARHRVFYSTRRQMPPPVSSDQMHIVVDELGVMSSTPVTGAEHEIFGDQSNTTVAIVRRAFKAMVPGKTLNRRLSRLS